MANHTQVAMTVKVNDREWTHVPNLRHSGPSDEVFTTITTENGTTVVRFGDGVQGAVPAPGSSNITATYRYGDGTVGNISKHIESEGDLRKFWIIVRDDLQVAGWGDVRALNRRRWWKWRR
jgi:hypothetical protein